MNKIGRHHRRLPDNLPTPPESSRKEETKKAKERRNQESPPPQERRNQESERLLEPSESLQRELQRLQVEANRRTNGEIRQQNYNAYQRRKYNAAAPAAPAAPAPAAELLVPAASRPETYIINYGAQNNDGGGGGAPEYSQEPMSWGSRSANYHRTRGSPSYWAGYSGE